MSSVIFLGMPISQSAFQIALLLMESNARSKSTKSRYSGEFHSLDCSIRTVLMWSVHPLPGLKPACLFLICLTVGDIRSRMIIAFIVLLRREIPHQFLHSLKSPFFGIVMVRLSFHFCAILPVFHTSTNSGVSAPAVVNASPLSNSAGMLSVPAALLFFSFFMALVTSRSVGGWVLLVSLPFGSSSIGSLSMQLFSKNFFHLFSCCSSVVRTCPFESFIGGTFVNFPVTVDIMCAYFYLLQLIRQ